MPKKQSSAPKRYAVYARCSSDDQAHRDFSTIDVQLEINCAYIANKGGVFTQAYTDGGKTGSNLKRPGWKKLLAAARAGLFDAVCITYMSRLGRGEAFIIAEHELKEAGVVVEMVKENFSDDMAGYVNKTITNLVNGMARFQASQNTKTKMEPMVARGYVVGRNAHFGYAKQDVVEPGISHRSDHRPPQVYVPHPEEGPLVRRAFELYAETRRAGDVMEYLNTVTGSKWTYTRVMALLRNEMYRGVLVFGDWRNESAHEPLVSQTLWDKVRAADAKRQRQPKENPKNEFTHYLKGLVRCSHCACMMTPVVRYGRTGSVFYYECVKHGKKQTMCPIKRVNAITLHEAVLGEIQRAAAHPTYMTGVIREVVKALPTEKQLPADIVAMQRQLRELDKGIGNILTAIEQGVSPLTLSERLKHLEAQRATVSRKAQELEGKIAASRRPRPTPEFVCAQWGRLGQLWAAATEVERQGIMQGAVRGVTMTDKEKGTCEVAVLPQVPSEWLTLTGSLGAGRGLSSILTGSAFAFNTVRFVFCAFKGGQSRKKTPCPERKQSL